MYRSIDFRHNNKATILFTDFHTESGRFPKYYDSNETYLKNP
ncbi:MAG: hypothetical protein HRT89_07925 [Lentisphaeria bacterium]|nr:hypothetical protein [Lentisphaeria bacterium]